MAEKTALLETISTISSTPMSPTAMTRKTARAVLERTRDRRTNAPSEVGHQIASISQYDYLGVPAASTWVAKGNAHGLSTWMTGQDKNALAAGTPVPQTFGTITPGAAPTTPATPSGAPKNPTKASVFLMKPKK